VPKAVEAAKSLHPRLSRIDFPGVDVEHIRCTGPEDSADPGLPRQVRNHAEVPASAPGETPVAQRKAGDAYLEEVRPQLQNGTAGIDAAEPAVAVMRHRGEHRGIVLEAHLL
jgi:hypothetical protein